MSHELYRTCVRVESSACARELNEILAGCIAGRYRVRASGRTSALCAFQLPEHALDASRDPRIVAVGHWCAADDPHNFLADQDELQRRICAGDLIQAVEREQNANSRRP
jgi:hypothetical protein